MRAIRCGALLLSAVWTAQAAAVNTENHKFPYAAALGTFTRTDNDRPDDNAGGFQLTLGMPFKRDQQWAAELSYWHARMDSTIDGKNDFQNGFSLDIVRDFGLYGWESTRWLRFKPFLAGGLAGIQEDVLGRKHYRPGVDYGGGVLFQLPWWGSAVRFDARAVTQFNNKRSSDADFLTDFRLGLGFQIPLPFYEHRVAVAPPKPCELAVVDPETGRKDCVADSDHDGVADTADRCPNTPPGTEVDEFGCTKAGATPVESGGVPEHAAPQSTELPVIRFVNDSSALTPEAKTALDQVIETLKGQPGLQVEIQGHTDSLGREAYNLWLSQQRAEAVRYFLVQHGVEATRLNAVGYGEYRPAASNDTEEGRVANRRVEFKLIVP